MPLSSSLIRSYVSQEKIKVYPWKQEHAKGASLDVCLGEYYFRMTKKQGLRNLYEKDSAKMLWGAPQSAITLREQDAELRSTLKSSVHLDEKIIILDPYESILGHTHEFIATNNSIVGEIRGRSTLRRNGLTVSADGNWGDPGFVGRWTLFIENHTSQTIPLIVGRRVAQLVFHEVTGTTEDYSTEHEGGKYQVSSTFEEVKKTWKPEMILPKMHQDRETSNRSLLFM